MMRSERRASPLLALIAFEVAAIAGLTWVGANSAMQVPWSDLSTWLSTSSVDELAMPLLRYLALGLAWWMLASTLLFVLAQLTRVPIAIRFAGAFTLPVVRRAVDGAMAVSIATTSVVGFAAGALNVSSIVNHNGGTATQLIANLNNANDPGGAAVGTPSTGTPTTTSSTTTPSTTAESLVTTSTSTTAAPSTTTSSTVSPTTTGNQAEAGNTDANEQATTSVAPTAGDGFVPTPKPGALATTTTVPQGPSTPANTPAPETPAPAAPSTSGTHTVVPGDNLWTISRDAIAENRGVDKKSISEADIRTYWLTVIDANKDSIRSHDPHWIFPGEVIQLPALDAPAAAAAGS